MAYWLKSPALELRYSTLMGYRKAIGRDDERRPQDGTAHAITRLIILRIDSKTLCGMTEETQVTMQLDTEGVRRGAVDGSMQPMLSIPKWKWSGGSSQESDGQQK